MKFAQDVSFLCDLYDAFFFDIWGTLHDGGVAFPEALAFLRHLKGRGKKVFLVSNAPRRAFRVAAEIEPKGIGPDLYDQILTSGEDVYDFLKDPEGRYTPLGYTFFHMGRPDHKIWEGTPFRPVSFLREASFVLMTDLMPGRYLLEEYGDLFLEARMMNLSMVCANPDQFVLSGGKKVWCAGSLASIYAQSGGPVYWHGKPIGVFFRKMMAMAPDVPARRMLMIGDGMETDIRGSARAGIDSVFLASGMFGRALGVNRGDPLDEPQIKSWMKAYPSHPTYVLSSLRMSP